MLFNNSSQLSTAEITLTSAQLKALDTVPVLLIPAQGAGTIISILNVQAKFTCPTGEAFGASDDMYMIVDPSSLDQNYGAIASSGFAGPTVDTYCTTTTNGLNVIDASDFENTDVLLFLKNGSITGNPADDNTVVVSALYKVFKL